MTKSDAQKTTGVMAKEWWKSKSNEQTIEDLVTMGVLHNKELAGAVHTPPTWHATIDEIWSAVYLGVCPR